MRNQSILHCDWILRLCWQPGVPSEQMNENLSVLVTLYIFASLYLLGSFLGWWQCIRFWKGDLRGRLKILLLLRMLQPFARGTSWYTLLLPIPIGLTLIYGAIKSQNFHFALIPVMVFIGFFFMFSTPPVVLFLGVTGATSKRLRNRIGWVPPGLLANLLRFSSYSPMTSFRSMSSMWRTVVKGLWKISGLIVVDARAESSFLVEEVHEVFAEGYGFKTVFVVCDDGDRPLLDVADPDGSLLPATGALVVREKEAGEAVARLTRSRQSLPTRPSAIAAKEPEHRNNDVPI